jgi:hypothetical protein
VRAEKSRLFKPFFAIRSVSPGLTPSRASGFSKLRTSELSEDGAREL